MLLLPTDGVNPWKSSAPADANDPTTTTTMSRTLRITRLPYGLSSSCAEAADRDQAFELVAPFRHARIYLDELAANPRRWVMLFRASMMRDIERLPTGTASTLLYSLWPGYLDRDDGQLQRLNLRRTG